MAEPALSLEHVTAGYGDVQVLEDVSFRVASGERLAVIGRNGVGKTTLLATIMGLTRLTGGRVALEGADISSMPTHRRSAAGLGLVPQTRDIFRSLSVEENLRAAMRGGARIEEAYALFPRLAERRRNGGEQLSGGEQQMLSIARALMARPRILLLDEPLEGLAPVIRDMLVAVFERLAAAGAHTIVLVEQHVSLALSFADRAILLDKGRIVFHGTSEVLRQDSALLSRHVGVSL